MLIELIQNSYIFYTIVFLITVVSAALGVSTSMLLPLAAIYFGSKESVGIITIFFLVQNISLMTMFWKNINFKIAKTVILFSIPGGILGALVLSHIPEELFGKVIAVAIILFIASDVNKHFSKKKEKSNQSVPLFGFIYGFLSGILGSGNLVKGPLFVSLGLLKEAYIGTYAFTSFFINIPKIGVYTYTGIINGDTFIKAIPFILISIVGILLGKIFLKQISSKVFYIVTIVFFLISAIALFFNTSI